MNIYNLSVKGDSHYQTGLPCQDSSSTEILESGAIMAISDGHGSKTYVRSDVGSALACQIAVALTKDFIKKNYDYLKSIGSVSYSPDSGNRQNNVFEQLFADIHNLWYEKIKEDARINKFSPEEKQKLGESGLRNIKIAYGCTLIVAVITQDFVFSYQIGDGRLFQISKANGWTQPVPWDKRCEDNTTTSLCDDSPVGEFRYSVSSNTTGIFGIFGCSDGIEDCYGGSHDKDFESDKLRIEYSAVIRGFLNRTNDLSFKESCSDLLYRQSKYFSHDDMSIAFLICATDDEERKWMELTELEYKKNKLDSTLSDLKEENKTLTDRKVKVEENKRTLKWALEAKNHEIGEKEREKGILEKEYETEENDIECGLGFKEEFSRSAEYLLGSIKEYTDRVNSSLTRRFYGKITELLSKLIEYFLKEINRNEQRRKELEDKIVKIKDAVSKLESDRTTYKRQLSSQEENLKGITARKIEVEQEITDFENEHSSEIEYFSQRIKELKEELSDCVGNEGINTDYTTDTDSQNLETSGTCDDMQSEAENGDDVAERILPTITIVNTKVKGENEDIQLIKESDQYEIRLVNESRQKINDKKGLDLLNLLIRNEKYLVDSVSDETEYLIIQFSGHWSINTCKWKDEAIYYILDPDCGQLIWDSFISAIPHD